MGLVIVISNVPFKRTHDSRHYTSDDGGAVTSGGLFYSLFSHSLVERSIHSFIHWSIRPFIGPLSPHGYIHPASTRRLSQASLTPHQRIKITLHHTVHTTRE